MDSTQQDNPSQDFADELTDESLDWATAIAGCVIMLCRSAKDGYGEGR